VEIGAGAVITARTEVSDEHVAARILITAASFKGAASEASDVDVTLGRAPLALAVLHAVEHAAAVHRAIREAENLRRWRCFIQAGVLLGCRGCTSLLGSAA